MHKPIENFGVLVGDDPPKATTSEIVGVLAGTVLALFVAGAFLAQIIFDNADIVWIKNWLGEIR